MSVQEDCMRLLELQHLLSDLSQEKFLTCHRLAQLYPVLLEGGSIRVGQVEVQGKLVKQGDASRWERDNLPRTSTGYLVKIAAKVLEKKP